jgi:hypothetical protein
VTPTSDECALVLKDFCSRNPPWTHQGFVVSTSDGTLAFIADRMPPPEPVFHSVPSSIVESGGSNSRGTKKFGTISPPSCPSTSCFVRHYFPKVPRQCDTSVTPTNLVNINRVFTTSFPQVISSMSGTEIIFRHGTNF